GTGSMGTGSMGTGSMGTGSMGTGSMGTGVLFANGSSGWVLEGRIRAFRNFNALWIRVLIEPIGTPPISTDYGRLMAKLFIRTWNGPDSMSIWALE
ncbi:MAG: hypothetical protein FI708_00490, partial [SAR202 cluster bacterium]|nr:hypothetical protein [SAR202 cluster bacterium]